MYLGLETGYIQSAESVERKMVKTSFQGTNPWGGEEGERSGLSGSCSLFLWTRAGNVARVGNSSKAFAALLASVLTVEVVVLICESLDGMSDDSTYCFGCCSRV